MEQTKEEIKEVKEKDIYILRNSKNQKKKYAIYTPKKKTISFGSAGYNDYTLEDDDEIAEKMLKTYIKRHGRKRPDGKLIENWNDPQTAGFWAKNLLWNQRVLDAAIEDTEERYNITITNELTE